MALSSTRNQCGRTPRRDSKPGLTASARVAPTTPRVLNLLIACALAASACQSHVGPESSTSPATTAPTRQSTAAYSPITPCLPGQMPICASQSCSGCPCGGWRCADRECTADADCGAGLRCGCRGPGAYVCPPGMAPDACENARCGGRVCRGASE